VPRALSAEARGCPPAWRTEWPRSLAPRRSAAAQDDLGRFGARVAAGGAELARQAAATRAEERRRVVRRPDAGAEPEIAPAAADEALAALRGRGLPFQPVVDGDVLPRLPLEAIGDGASARVPVLVGTNADESKLFLFLDPEGGALDAAGLEARAGELLGARAGHVIAVYRDARRARGESVAPAELWSAIESDRTMRHPAMHLAERQRAHQPRTYAYLFTWPSPFMGGALGACHALELPFVFGTLGHPMLRPFAGKGPAAEALATRVQDAWIAFARAGDPSHPGIGAWPAYDAATRATMILDRECRVEAAPREPERAVWDAVG